MCKNKKTQKIDLVLHDVHTWADKSWGVLSHAVSTAQTWGKKLVLLPVRVLYLYGPGLVFWEGAEVYDICAAISKTPSDVWLKLPDECDNLIDRKVNALAICVYAVLLGVMLHYALYACWFRSMIMRPFLAAQAQQPIMMILDKQQHIKDAQETKKSQKPS